MFCPPDEGPEEDEDFASDDASAELMPETPHLIPRSFALVRSSSSAAALKHDGAMRTATEDVVTDTISETWTTAWSLSTTGFGG
jgi:hypothetical protein